MHHSHEPKSPPRYPGQPEGLPRDYGHFHAQGLDRGEWSLPVPDRLALLLAVLVGLWTSGAFLLDAGAVALPRASEPYDAALYPWNFFWIGDALGAEDGSLLFTRRFFHPDGEGLTLYTPTYLYGFLAQPLIWCFGEVRGPFVATAVFLAVSSVFTLMLAYILARRVGLEAAPAWITALLVTWAAGRLMNAPRLNLFCTEFLLLYFILLQRWWTSARSVHAALCGAAAAALLFQSQPLFLLAVLGTAAAGVGLAVTRIGTTRSQSESPVRRTHARTLPLAFLAFLVLAGPFLWQMSVEIRAGGPAFEQAERMLAIPDNSLDLSALVLPHRLDAGYGEWLGARRPSFFEGQAPGSTVSFFLGLTALALVALSLCGARRRTVLAVWIAVLCVFVFALGPVIRWRDTALISGPYAWIAKIPPFGLDKSPVRAVFLVEVGLALLAGIGFQRLLQWTRWTGPRTALATLAVSGLLAFELGETLPLRSIEPRIEIDARLRELVPAERRGAVLDLPYADPATGGSHRIDSLSQALGAVHHKPIFGALYPRATRRNAARWESTFLCAALRALWNAPAETETAALIAPMTEEQRMSIRDDLVELDVGWIFVHHLADDPPARQRFSERIAALLRACDLGEERELSFGAHWTVTAFPTLR